MFWWRMITYCSIFISSSMRKPVHRCEVCLLFQSIANITTVVLWNIHFWAMFLSVKKNLPVFIDSICVWLRTFRGWLLSNIWRQWESVKQEWKRLDSTKYDVHSWLATAYHNDARHLREVSGNHKVIGSNYFNHKIIRIICGHIFGT